MFYRNRAHRNSFFTPVLLTATASLLFSFSSAHAQSVEQVPEQSVPQPAPIIEAPSFSGAAAAQPDAQSSAQAVAPAVAPEAMTAAVEATVPAEAQLPVDTLTTIPGDDQEVARKVADINKRMALMTAQLAELELKMKIAQKVQEIKDVGKKKENAHDPLAAQNGMPGMPGFSNFPGMPQQMPPAVPEKNLSVTQLPLDLNASTRDRSSDIMVTSIEGIDGNLAAMMSLDGEPARKIRVGETLGKWTIRSIDVESVTLQKGKTERKVYVGATSAMAPAVSAPTGGSEQPVTTTTGSSAFYIPPISDSALSGTH